MHLPPIPPPQEPPPYDLDPSNFPGQGGNEPGGLLGVLQALMRQNQNQPAAESDSAANSVPKYHFDNDGSPQGGLLGRLLALQDQKAAKAVGAYGGDGTGAGRTIDALPPELPTAQQKPIRYLSRRSPR